MFTGWVLELLRPVQVSGAASSVNPHPMTTKAEERRFCCFPHYALALLSSWDCSCGISRDFTTCGSFAFILTKNGVIPIWRCKQECVLNPRASQRVQSRCGVCAACLNWGVAIVGDSAAAAEPVAVRHRQMARIVSQRCAVLGASCMASLWTWVVGFSHWATRGRLLGLTSKCHHWVQC